MYDENLLRAKMAYNRMTVVSLAKILGINPCTLHRKLSGTVDFTRGEIAAISIALSLSDLQIVEIFFAKHLTLA